MKKLLFLLVMLISVLNISKVNAANIDKNYYPYKPRWADVYVGINLGNDVDQTADRPEWDMIYNPLHYLTDVAFSYYIGVRPLEIFPFFRNFRIEGERMYRVSKYDIIYNSEVATWKPQTDLPASGRIALHNATMFNLFYDMRWFSDVFYPYVGFGMGKGKLQVIALDFTELPNGVGEEYDGSKSGANIQQFMIGFQYDTKIIKTSFFVEYRYVMGDSITVKPTYYGSEGIELTDSSFVPPSDRSLKYKVQSLSLGIKYYLY